MTASAPRRRRSFRPFPFVSGLGPVLTALFLLVLPALVPVVAPALGQQGTQEGTAAETGGGETGAAASAEIRSLVEALRSDETREALLKALEEAAGAAQPAAEAASEEAAPVIQSFGRRIAETTQSMAEQTAATLMEFGRELVSAPARLIAIDAAEVELLIEAVLDVALAIVVTYAIFVILRRLAVIVYRRMGRVASDAGPFRKIVLIVASTAIDAGVVVLAWAGGYLITLTVFGEFGTVGIRQSLYLNAFLVVELFKVLLRLVFAPSTGDLRVLNISDAAARYVTSRLTWIASLVGYGQLFVIPIFNRGISYAAGQAISLVIALIALAIALSMTVRHRSAVTAWILGEATGNENPSRSLRRFAQTWFWLVLLYLAFLFFVVIARPANELLTVLWSSGQVLVAVVAGLTVTGWLSKVIASGISLPDSLSNRLPRLEARLNGFVPQLLTGLRIVIFLAVLVFALDALNILDVGGWLDSQIGVWITGAVLSVAFILLGAFAVWLAMTSWVDYRLNPDNGRAASAREQTLLSLLRNAATVAILVITLMFALSELGIDIAPLIASAGVLGLAIGFGAQKLVQDIITGIFIQLENAINVGDVVTVGGSTGVVERLTIRSVSLRDLSGVYHIIPFSSVDMVSNFMREFSYHVCDMGVAYREDYNAVREAMYDAFTMLRDDPDYKYAIIGDMEWFGLQAFGDSAVVMRSRIKTLPGEQWRVGRAYNRTIKQVFDERGIEIPFPHQTLYFGEDRSGRAPPAYVVLEQGKGKAQASPRLEEAESRAPADAEPGAPVSGDMPDND